MSAPLVILVVLMLGVIFVNGWTDAPNAIATAISTRVIRPATAVRMAVFFNFLGAFAMTLVNSKVAATISNIVKFHPEENNLALVALAAAMFSIVLWATVAWYFGIPTSESHALIAGVTGGAIALGGFSSVNPHEWSKVLIGLGISTILGFASGYATTKLIEILFYRMRRNKANKIFGIGQIFGAASMSFMHGAQDGQKFMGIFLLSIYLYNSNMVSHSADGTFSIPMWLIILCSAVMGLGTSVGGYRIIKAVGMDMVKLEKYQGFAADTAASLSLLLSSLAGVPVSTTHTKTAAIMGVGASRRLSAVNWSVVKDMVLAWILTFPGCGLIAWFMAKIFLKVF
ncbi:MAG: Low-affinity inorganic phosphate transporter 1 [Firmicutes bacterium ADurb.Bin193]|nr:MAG: Low-affinity inorganic phosphate transporter 1 [Firmicutes bacterium ADurb.Bin193]